MAMSPAVTDVVKTLFSVRKMEDAGNIVVFGADEGDMIINKKTGTCIPINDDGRTFTMDIFVPPNEGTIKNELDKVPSSNFWTALIEKPEPTFGRHP